MSEKIGKKHLFLPKIQGDFIHKLNEKHALTGSKESDEEKRSYSAIAAEKILRTLNDGHLTTVEGSLAFLDKRSASEDEPLPSLVYRLLSKENGTVMDFQGMQLVTFGTVSEQIEVEKPVLSGAALGRGKGGNPLDALKK